MFLTENTRNNTLDGYRGFPEFYGKMGDYCLPMGCGKIISFADSKA